MSMKTNTVAAIAALMALGGVAACDANDGPIEEAAEEVDEAADELGEMVEDADE
jgi:hypothetical protein